RFAAARPSNCAYRIGRVCCGVRRCLTGLRSGHLARLEIARVYAELLLELQVRKTPHRFRSHGRLGGLLEKAPVTLHCLIKSLINFYLLHVRMHTVQVGERRPRWLVMRGAADEESCRKHDGDGMAT